MPINHREIAFEAAIEHHLLDAAGYTKADPANFDRERAVAPTVLIPFIKDTQPETWESLEKLHSSETEAVVLDDLCKAMDSQGSLAVIRHGFKRFGKLIRVAYFAPAHSMNPDTERLYAANRLTVSRELGDRTQAIATGRFLWGRVLIGHGEAEGSAEVADG